MDPTSEPTEPQVYDVEVKPKELAKILDAQLAEEAEAMEALMAEYRKLQEAQRDTKQKRAALYWKIREQERLEAEAQRREEEAARALIHAALLKQKAVHFDEVTKGAKWRARAMPHQLDGSSHLAAAGRAILADQPGLGKTLASIIWMDKLEANRVLIIGPGDVGINFVNELNLYSDRPVMDLSNQPKATQQMFLAHAKRFDKVAVFLNYEAWYRNLALLDWVIEANFDTLVVDEAHRVKETDKLPYKGVEAIVMAETQCPRCHAPINANVAAGRWDCTNPDCDWDSYTNIGEYKRHQRSSIQNLLLMTGTPIPNRPSEMFALLHLVDPVLFGTKKKFTDDYTKMVGNFEVWKSPEIRDTFASKLSAFYLRRTYESVGIELPAQDVIYHNIEFQPELYPKQAKLMKQLRKFNQMEIEKDRTMTIWQKIVLLLRERQAATWPGGIVMKEYVYDEKGNLKLDFLNTYKNGDPRPVTRDIHVGDLPKD
jgi:SNF2 family DNA or RNA helicase